MKADNKFLCPHCGKEIQAALLNSWKASQVGRVTSEKKAASSAENGKNGGRPKMKKTNEFTLNVAKDGKPRVLRLVTDGGSQYSLVVCYPDGQQVQAKYQPTEKGHIPDIKWYAAKNGFEVCPEQ